MYNFPIGVIINSFRTDIPTSVKKVDPWHDTSNVRAINEELKKQRLERKKQAETTAAHSTAQRLHVRVAQEQP